MAYEDGLWLTARQRQSLRLQWRILPFLSHYFSFHAQFGAGNLLRLMRHVSRLRIRLERETLIPKSFRYFRSAAVRTD